MTLARLLAILLAVSFSAAAPAQAPAKKPFEPAVGQEGKDVIWVPTPDVLVEKMLDMVKLTPKDYVIDLGSGDGRNIIAAAKRGARGHGVEYNPDMVELSNRRAAEAGVADKAKFIRGDMFEADISKASVMALFLLPDNLRRLRPKFLALKPGSRIVSNGFLIENWDYEETGVSTGECGSWCTAYLYIVPARVAGTWRLEQGELRLEQEATKVSGALYADGSLPVQDGKVLGEQISFRIGDQQFSARVKGDTMTGTNSRTGKPWTAKRVR